jgi:LCP family protein required for cell wall assembly
MLAEGQRSPAAKRRKRRHILRWISLGVVVIIIGALVTAYYEYRTIDDSIHRVPVTDLGKRPPVYSTTSMNILLFGSDSRTGLDHHMQVLLHSGGLSDSSGPGNTDTIMLVHISPGRHGVTVMSIPRDTMVPLYQCAGGGGYRGQQANPGATERINSLLSAGGPSCLWKTVEQETGIRIDHFIEIGLAGFVNVINDLGGVNVCAPFNVDDPVSGLVLPAGEHHISGVTALDFWRTREDIGVGSDLQRIQRDQFMSAQVVQGTIHSNLLSDPAKLLQVAGDAAPNLTTDSGMSLPGLVSIGGSLRSLSGKDVQFVTAPTQPDASNPATVDFQQPQADQLFSAIARDVSLGGSGTKGSGTATGKTPGSPGVSPFQVKVRILNGNGMSGIAAVAAGELSSRGFTVTGTADAPAFGYATSVIEYGSATSLPAAQELKSQLTAAKLQLTPGLPSGQVTLILGNDFTDLAPQTASQRSGSAAPTVSPAVSAQAISAARAGSAPATSASGTPSGTASGSPSVSPSASPSGGSGISSAAAANGGITAASSCGSDAGAFQGPLSP